MFVGIDDTDSLEGMCTTFIASRLLQLMKAKVEIKGFPRLIRLNPNIPFKTRGNGAVSFEIENSDEKIKKVIVDFVLKNSQREENTNPGIVFLDEVSKELRKFSRRALHQVISIRKAKILAKILGADIHGGGNMRGIIGALAAIGMPLKDYTFELLSYRLEKNFGKRRRVNEKSVKEMDRRFFPKIWDNYDYENKHICISPNGKDPVLYGVRGENPQMLLRAQRMLLTEEVDHLRIFLTNQGTDQHLERKKISEIEEYNSVITKGVVSQKPQNLKGGHVIFKIKDDEEIFCAAFEPTKNFKKVVRLLEIGDLVEAFGGVKGTKHGFTLNLEKLKVLNLVKKYKVLKPRCMKCGRMMKSVGRERGYRCRRCKTKASKEASEKIFFERELRKGFYEVPPVARRHLAKPLLRF
ncbi:MAG: DUF1743 domain-containing protein [Candidatus Methanofastidiosia archaeon]